MPDCASKGNRTRWLHKSREGGIPMDVNEMIRGEPRRLLQWIQQQAGISRRKAQELIDAGEVSVNDAVITDPFAMYEPTQIEFLRLRGHPLATADPAPRVYRYYKPAGVLCSHDDPHSGNTVGRILRAEGFIGYTWVGRLDNDSEGLLLLTNDGDLVYTHTHPRYEIPKTYHVWIRRKPRKGEMERVFAQMKKGILDSGDRLSILRGVWMGRPPHAEVVLAEGKKREVRRLFAHFDLPVTRLQRTAIGPISLGNLAPGEIQRVPADQERDLLTSARRLLRQQPPGGRQRGLL